MKSIAGVNLGPRHRGQFAKGDVVQHASLGVGEVVNEWGVWYACRGCYKGIPPHQLIKRKVSRRGERVWEKLSPCCQATAFLVTGSGIFDVKFSDGKTRAINQCWLEEVPSAARRVPASAVDGLRRGEPRKEQVAA